MADFLDNLASQLSFLGNPLANIDVIKKATGFYAAHTEHGGVGDMGKSFFHAEAEQVLGGLGAAGTIFGKGLEAAASADPTQIVTRPIVHAAGGGDTEWDTGLVGLTTRAFDKAGRFMTYLSLTGNEFRNPLPNASNYNRRAWDMAFSGRADHIGFGEAMLAGDSVVTDPNGLAKLRQEMDGTWYAQAVSGTLDFIMYSAIDPTRVAGKAIGRARAAGSVADASEADRLATALNEAQDAAAPMPKTGLVGRTALGYHLSDSAKASYQWESKGRLDNVTDVNQIINELEPRLGMGGGATKQAIPAVAEMYADASRVTSDINLQRQIKLNIDYALTGSTEAMNWLAREYPGIAAKGRRMSNAPSEFTLLEDAMDAYASRGNDIASFSLGDYVKRHYSDPAQVAELEAFGERVQRLEKFRSAIWESGPEGGPVEFGTTTTGVQVTPRNLEKLKTAINNRVGSSYIYQDGATGRTTRVITSLTTPGAHGFVSLVDPVLGNRQLSYHLRQFAQNMDDFGAADIKAISEQFLKLDPAARERYVRQINDLMLSKIAKKYGYTPEQTKSLLAETSAAYRDGRKFAMDAAVRSVENGEQYAKLGDLGGTDTFLDAAHLQSHLQDTAGIFDWKTADQIVRDFKNNTRGATVVARNAKDFALKGIATYHTAWKHAQLGRFGLIFRVLMDTDLRANAMIGTAGMLMQTINGALAIKRNGKLPLVPGSELDSAVSSMAYMQAHEVRRANLELLQESNQDLVKARALYAQIARAEELEKIFLSRTKTNNLFNKQQGIYKRKAAEARALAERLKGEVNPKALDAVSVDIAAARTRARRVSPDALKQRLVQKLDDTGNVSPFTGQPLSIRALQKQRDLAEQSRYDARGVLSEAEDRYLTPEEYKHANATRRREYTYKGVNVTLSPVENDMQLASLPDEVRGSSAGLSSLLLGSDMDTNLWQGRIEVNHWKGHVEADDIQWHKKYAIAMQNLMDSHTVRRLINEGDAVTPASAKAILRSFADDPIVANEFRQSVGGGTADDFAQWLGDLLISKESMTRSPNAEVQARLMERLRQNKLLTPEEVEALVPPDARFPIFGPNIVNDRTRSIGKKFLDRFYRAFVDLPDVHLARIPAYVGLYHKNVQLLLKGYAEKALARGRNYLLPEEAHELHLRAKGRAMNDARRDMYDIHRRLGSEGVMRYIAPFFAPWFDAMQSWARLIYDDPSRFGWLMRLANSPDMFNLTTNQDGQPVAPWDGTNLQDKVLNVPLAGLGGIESFGVNFGSMNTITQGNTPFSPGAGPLAQIAGTVVVADVMPHVFPEGWKWMQANPDNIISQTLFMRPGDVPKGDLHTLIGTQLPSYMRTFSDVFLGDNGFGNTYTNAFGTRYNDLIRQYREAHGGADPDADELKRIREDASMGARAAAVLRSAVSFNLGLSGRAAPEGQFYMDQMHALNAASDLLYANGTTPEQVFALNYPSAANLNWSFSENEGNLQATVNATTAYMKHKKLMDDNPDVMWFIAGPDNLINSADPNGEFSQGAYNQQLTLGLRKKLSEDELVKQSEIAMGQGRYNAFMNALRIYMAQNGIKSLNSKAAGNLSGLRANYVEQIRAQFPGWAEYFDGLNSTGLQGRQIDQIQKVIEDGGREFQRRPDVVTTQRYLLARDAVIAQAQAQGIVGWQTATSVKPLRDLLHAYGMQLARQDIVFAQTWDRLFEHEFNKDLATARQAQLSEALG